MGFVFTRIAPFRTSDNKEVDFVLEKPNGELVAIEVKQRDNGVVLYRGHELIPFGPNLWAIPLSNLWL